MANCQSVLFGSIGQECGKNKGGVKRIWLAPSSAGTEYFTYSEETHSGVTLNNEISGVTGGDWTEFTARKGTANFTSTLNKDEANGVQYFNTQINMAFSRMETQKRIALASLAITDTIGVVEDSNGNYWGLGTSEDPISMSANTGETGSAKTDTNGYTVTLSVDSDELPLMLSSEAVKGFKTLIGE